MSRIEKTVFISYRRATGAGWALAISQNLTHHGYDVFLDYRGIASGDFEQIILENIRARAHFLVLLTPSALKHINRPGDWLRREIETALEHRRNVVPLMLDGFDFTSRAIGTRLTGTLAPLKNYNGLTVPVEYFDEAMHRLRTKHLNVAIEAILHPASVVARQAAIAQHAALQAAPKVPSDELTAERWFEFGIGATDPDTIIFNQSEAIRLKPDFSAAYNNRGVARSQKGDLDGAMADFTEAIRLDRSDADVYNNRGNVRGGKGDLDGALDDFTEAIRLDPLTPVADYNRARIRFKKSDLDGALADYTEAIRLDPSDANAYTNRGLIRSGKGDLDGALADYSAAIRLDLDPAAAAVPYRNRAVVHSEMGNLDSALADLTEAIRFDPRAAAV